MNRIHNAEQRSRARSQAGSRDRCAAFVGFILFGSLAAAADDAPAIDRTEISVLRLRPQAAVMDERLTLGDVLVFADAAPRLAAELCDKPVPLSIKAPGKTELSRQQIETQLVALGVNRSRVLLNGAASCAVTLTAPQPQATKSPEEDKVEALIVTPENAGTTTLADAIRRKLGDELAGLGGAPSVEFEAASRDFLALTSPPFEFDVRSGRSSGLGLREVIVSLRRDGRTQRSLRVGANVKLTRSVLVATKPLNVGGYITRDSLELTPRVFTSNEELGLTDVEPIVGQQVQQFVPIGQMVRQKDVKSVDLVKRSKPVTIESDGPVTIRATGVALDNGGFGDSVRVRIGDGKKNRREVRGVVSGVATVRLAEGD
ncbi:MAG: flagellar basal body P-ring formation protein FlgA [Planctomycetes bacterium]|nr:flagellar basal body P-ring formation protein FlgA [Planctomycetota bacterium]